MTEDGGFIMCLNVGNIVFILMHLCFEAEVSSAISPSTHYLKLKLMFKYLKFTVNYLLRNLKLSLNVGNASSYV